MGEEFLPFCSWLSWSPVLNILDECMCTSIPGNCGGVFETTAFRPLPRPFPVPVFTTRTLGHTPDVAVTPVFLLSFTVGVSCLPEDGHCFLPPRSTDHPGLCVNFPSNFTIAEDSPWGWLSPTLALLSAAKEHGHLHVGLIAPLWAILSHWETELGRP